MATGAKNLLKLCNTKYHGLCPDSLLDMTGTKLYCISVRGILCVNCEQHAKS